MYISENLTESRLSLHKAAPKVCGHKSVWTNDGNVTTKIDDMCVLVNSIEDLT